MSVAPSATYRLQLNAGFGFQAAAAIVPYLARLGVSAVYSSPGFRARPGSAHGYDVVDPRHVNPELGGEADLIDFVMARARHGLGLVLDIVPNHMAATWENEWWRDLLEHGASSPFATYFDVDWAALARDDHERLLIPVLGAPYAQVLGRGELTLVCDDGLELRYFEHRYPLDPATYGTVLDAVADRTPALREMLHALAAVSRQIPARQASELEARSLRRVQGAVLKQQTVAFFGEHEEAGLALAAACEAEPRASGVVHRVLAEQAYRLCHWRLAKERLNYRRFFDISDLVALAIERNEVFAARHLVELELVRRGIVTGLRIDHIDGLADPERYLTTLDRVTREVRDGAPFYVVAEKILGPSEHLPESWPIAGTTGYDALNALSRPFVDPVGLESLRATWTEATGDGRSFAEVYVECQRLVIEELFASELSRLVRELARLAVHDLDGCDLSFRELYRALLEVSVALPVYRTYVRDAHPSDVDRARITDAIRVARRTTPKHEVSAAAFLFLGRVLRMETSDDGEREPWLRFVKRWQQWTGAVMAKGLEDTAFYRYGVLLSLNEVGGDGGARRDVNGVEELHRHNAHVATRSPMTMLATTTHDTKRSEDARARLNVLSELAPAWRRHLRRWMTLNNARRVDVDGRSVPDPSAEIFLYQTMLAAWPFLDAEIPAFAERLRAYVSKAIREAKAHTSWTDPNEDYEAAVLGFVDQLFASREEHGAFWTDFLQLQQRVAAAGAVGSLAMLALKVGSPGVADFYQGTELWDFSMVDPDNRRPIDYERRSRLLDEVANVTGRSAVRALCERWRDGAIKLFVTHKGLLLRRADPDLFVGGEYHPLVVTGENSEHLCAFARRAGERWLLTIAPRAIIRLDRNASPSRSLAPSLTAARVVLPEGAPSSFLHALTGEQLVAVNGSFSVAEALAACPCAWLVGEAVTSPGSSATPK